MPRTLLSDNFYQSVGTWGPESGYGLIGYLYDVVSVLPLDINSINTNQLSILLYRYFTAHYLTNQLFRLQLVYNSTKFISFCVICNTSFIILFHMPNYKI